MTNRRSFLFGAASALAAPAVVRADSLMKLFVPKAEVLLPTSYTMERIALGFAITQEAIEDNLYASLNAHYTAMLVTAMRNSVFAE